MSQPVDREIRITLIGEASAQELPPVDVAVTAVRSEQVAPDAITVGVLPVWGIAVGWVLGIVLVTQAIKYVARAAGAKERLGARRWRRWMYVVPVAVGVLLSGLFGPQLATVFGLRFGVLPSLLILGPGSGAAAAFAYDVFRAVVLPVLPTVLIGTIERVTGVEIPEGVGQLGDDASDVLELDP